jgi:hypothetical protein
MPDYNMYGLSPRSFEQLLQAITPSVIGPGTVMFGDGPDGAREATFEGKTHYPSSSEPWDGYVVIQAKFRQRFHSADSDGKWALDELTKELRKFSSKKRKLRQPEYYIFCTNVVLTPVNETGTKDRAFKILSDFKRRSGLKDFAVWDADQLRAYLDDLPGVRQTYSAWITPGDALSILIRSFEWSHPNFDTLMTSFLQKELIADQYVNLEQAGHATEEKTVMARVFVDLPATVQQTSDPPDEQKELKQQFPGFVRDFVAAGARRHAPGSEGPRGSKDGPNSLTGRYVLVGGPGPESGNECTRTPCVTVSPRICSTPARICGLFNCCSATRI